MLILIFLSCSGGIFPPPPAVGHLLSILPHPISFHGPFVSIDDLINVYSNLSLPDEFSPPVNNLNHIKKRDADSPVNQPSLKLFDVAVKASQTNPMNFHAFNLNGNSLSNSPNINDIDDKFKLKRTLDDDDQDDENSNSNPVNLDIYRQRKFQNRHK